ncbi:hypothetical protein DB347_18340 [Opitutaceae bacterium EW11]|nr:hypothetical protein DB347_18340 [Opitutaceae bacterium EW11]
MLIVSPAFAPISTPDSQRVRMSLPHYREFGWEPIVLTVDPRHIPETREDGLLATLPPDVTIRRCGALPLRFARLLGLGNLGLRAWFPLLFVGVRTIRREKIDLVLFSTTQFVTLPLGRIWRRLCGVPYVVDLQDPWRTDYYERPGVRRPPGGWKYQFARFQAWLLEEWSFRRVAAFISVSAEYLFDLRRRYAWFSSVPSEVLHFGASERDLEIARAQDASAERAPDSASGPAVRFVYTGAAGPITPHAVSLLFEAARQFRATEPAAASRLRFEFLGTSYAPRDLARPSILPLAEKAGIADLVTEYPARLGHLETLRVQADADVLLLLGSSDLAYSPSKIYPYYLSGRPILALVFRNSCLETILRELNCSYLVTFENSADSSSTVQLLHAFFRATLAGTAASLLPVRNDDLFRREYLARTLTAKQAALFDVALRPPDAPTV